MDRIYMYCYFLPAGRYAGAVQAVILCRSVCLSVSVTRRCSIEKVAQLDRVDFGIQAFLCLFYIVLYGNSRISKKGYFPLRLPKFRKISPRRVACAVNSRPTTDYHSDLPSLCTALWT